MTGPSQPGYGQQPPGYQPAPSTGPGYGPSTGRAFGVAGAVLAVIGAALIVVAYTALDWFTHSSTDGPSHFSDVKNVVKQADAVGLANSFAKLYFGWLGWVLLVAAFVLALLANVPSAAAGVARPLGAVVGLAGIGATFWALKFLSTSKPSYSEYLKHARLGFWFTVAGFVLIAIGAMVGPRRTAAR